MVVIIITTSIIIIIVMGRNRKLWMYQFFLIKLIPFFRASCKNSFFMMDVGMVQQYFSVFKLGGYFINKVIVFTLLFARK